MALNIKNSEVERLAAEVAQITKESKTQVIRIALEERLFRLSQSAEEKRKRIREAFETRIWPNVPKDVLGKKITKQEREDILGYGPDGV